MIIGLAIHGIEISGKINNKTYDYGGESNSKNNASGRYALVGNGTEVKLYWGNQELTNFTFNETITFDKISIGFSKSPDYNVQNMYIENLYIGEPLYYKDLV